MFKLAGAENFIKSEELSEYNLGNFEKVFQIFAT